MQIIRRLFIPQIILFFKFRKIYFYIIIFAIINHLTSFLIHFSYGECMYWWTRFQTALYILLPPKVDRTTFWNEPTQYTHFFYKYFFLFEAFSNESTKIFQTFFTCFSIMLVNYYQVFIVDNSLLNKNIVRKTWII